MKNTLDWIFSLCAFFCAAGSGFAAPAKTVVDVSIDGEISAAQTYILNRAVAAAAEISADALLIDLNTPGGDFGPGWTFSIKDMEVEINEERGIAYDEYGNIIR